MNRRASSAFCMPCHGGARQTEVPVSASGKEGKGRVNGGEIAGAKRTYAGVHIAETNLYTREKGSNTRDGKVVSLCHE